MVRKKKLLFIIQWYPSKDSANGYCDENIIEELKKTDLYEIHCLTYRNNKQKLLERSNGIVVHRYNKGIFWDLFVWAKENRGKQLGRVVLRLQRIWLRVKEVLYFFNYPCYEPFYAFLAAHAANRLHKKERFDIVISEHHGFDTLYAGHFLKKKHDSVKFIPILWDPFSGRNIAHYMPEQLGIYLNERKEKKLLSNADYIISMKSSEGYHRTNSTQKSYYDRMVFLDIPKLVPVTDLQTTTEYVKSGMINILYCGIMDKYHRNPSYILKLFESSKYSSKINLIFFSRGDAVELIKMEKNNFAGNLDVYDYIDKAKLNTVINSVDVLINIGNNIPTMVPSKIFEYISHCKPIISTYKIDNDSSVPYLKKYEAALCLDERVDVTENVEKFDEFVDNIPNYNIEFSNLCKTYSLNTPACYAELLHKIAFNEVN